MTGELNMKLGSLLVGTVTAATLTLALCGCATGSGGGGGGGGGDGNGDGAVQDPLPEYQLGLDDELDASIGAITAADNAIVECIGEDITYNEEGVLLSLKLGYTAGATAGMSFPEFVADLAELEQGKSDEICNTTLENASEELLGLIARLTEARNHGRECRGDDPTLTDENSLLYLKVQYFKYSVRDFPTMLDFAAPFVEEAEQVAEDECN
jgi:hypothetical protein